MKILKNLRLIEYLDYLIRNKATGSPEQLACKLDISERQVYRIIEELKDIGFPIYYCKVSGSYCYEICPELNFEIQIDGKYLLKIGKRTTADNKCQ